ncbi:hypothetical protein E2C01_022393 [Portunus trituberculatus]|uniref:Uncharacterized protein n=1 Tax=Portunus trituberculatus TaxID=210409 RepID=A0A5B7E7K8_PORTR|nr:hypothetical protein [Portunus trituberculatus]
MAAAFSSPGEVEWRRLRHDPASLTRGDLYATPGGGSEALLASRTSMALSPRSPGECASRTVTDREEGKGGRQLSAPPSWLA